MIATSCRKNKNMPLSVLAKSHYLSDLYGSRIVVDKHSFTVETLEYSARVSIHVSRFGEAGPTYGSKEQFHTIIGWIILNPRVERRRQQLPKIVEVDLFSNQFDSPSRTNFVHFSHPFQLVSHAFHADLNGNHADFVGSTITQ